MILTRDNLTNDRRPQSRKGKKKVQLKLSVLEPLWLILIIFLPSCEEITAWELDDQSAGKLVIESILTNELKTQEVRLSQSFSALNGEAKPILDAVVRVEAGGQRAFFLHDAGEPGVYKSEVDFGISALEYTLIIEWSGEIYTASSEPVGVNGFSLDNVIFPEKENSDSLTFPDFTDYYSLNEQVMYEVDVDWAHLTNISPTKARVYYFTFNTIHVNSIIRPEREQIFFPRGSIVIVRKYSLNDEFAKYLQAVAAETVWNGNVFYVPASNPPTNISNGGLGFFSTCAVVADTVVAE